MKKDWFEKWFASEDYLDVYRHRNDDDSNKIISLILSNVELEPGSKVLDAACGAGRHSIKFAEKGFDVHGFDLSETLLNIATKEARAKGLNIEFTHADKRYFETDRKFDLIVSLFTSFGYFHSDEENFAFPRNAFHMLNENGYYVLDYLNKIYLENNLVEFSNKTISDKEIQESRRIAEDRIEKKIEIKKNGERREFIESVKLYSAEALMSEFTIIGYKALKLFGDYDGNIFDPQKSERCIIIFKK